MSPAYVVSRTLVALEAVYHSGAVFALKVPLTTNGVPAPASTHGPLPALSVYPLATESVREMVVVAVPLFVAAPLPPAPRVRS
jgi:hypothetical protein